MAMTVESGNFWQVTQPLLVLTCASALLATNVETLPAQRSLCSLPGSTEEPVLFF